ncbi:MAG: SpoIIE family protein phosphatase [bacterium]|nr:SpoIIE family protein phosphatase [bacterium]
MSKKRIILAEDEEHARLTLTMVLNNSGFEVVAAADGKEALDALVTAEKEDNPFDLLITDIQMPRLTGIQLLDELEKRNIHLSILVISGFGDKRTVIQLMRRGCSDFIEKPFFPKELVFSIEAILEKNELAEVEKREQRDQVEREKNRMNREIDAYKQSYSELSQQFDSAVDSYKNIIDIDNEGLKTAAAYHFEPLSRLGGDFFDIRNTRRGVDVFVADVAGHDMGAAFHAVLLKAFFEKNSKLEKDGRSFFRILNNQLIDNEKTGRMVTAVFMGLNLEEKKGEAVFAGHPPLLKVEKNRETISFFPDSSVSSSVLGIFEDISFNSSTFPLETGERFIFYTDGIIETYRVDGPTGKKTKLTQEGFVNIIKKYKKLELEPMIDAAWQDILQFSLHKPKDDMLLLGIEIP